MGDFLKDIRREPAPLTFRLDEGQMARYSAWRKTVDLRILQHQIATGTMLDGAPIDQDILSLLRMAAAAGDTRPYYGAIAGAYRFSFTPTALGTVVIVSHVETGEELNLTDYDDW